MCQIILENNSEINQYLDELKKEIDKEYDTLFQKLGIKPELCNSVRDGIDKTYRTMLLTGGIGFELNKILEKN